MTFFLLVAASVEAGAAVEISARPQPVLIEEIAGAKAGTIDSGEIVESR